MDSYASELDRIIKYWLGAGETADVILRDTLKRLTELVVEESPTPQPLRGDASSGATPRPSSESGSESFQKKHVSDDSDDSLMWLFVGITMGLIAMGLIVPLALYLGFFPHAPSG